ncbi:MAG: biopolymer transporter ExbD [Methylotenera sp.]|nr:biopolymer transporter ExbD [Oligoflexia bacterium]
MAGTFGGGDDEVISGINVTPLVDVVLVLLVIFLMTAPVIYQSAIKVQLPKAKSGEQAEKSPLNFTLTKEGDLMWDKEKISWETLAQRLKAMGTQTPEQTAVISADQTTQHGTVIRLMDALRQAGLTRFALNVEGPAASK